MAMIALSIVLMVADQRWKMLGGARSVLVFVVAPIHWVADAPLFFLDGLNGFLDSKQHVIDENKQLQSQILTLQQKAQKLSFFEAENAHLRELLNAATIMNQESVVVAELTGVDPDPFNHEIIINKGKSDDSYIGQPVLDAYGLMGQVIEVGPISSRVLLVTDHRHSLSVQINRNGVRAIAGGMGDINKLTIRYVADTADIVVGDLLVSSGLDQRFPKGYPVAEVTEVHRDPGQVFLTVFAKPKARLDRSRYVMLIINKHEGEP
jgi:rod shape-determining protein MreC